MYFCYWWRHWGLVLPRRHFFTGKGGWFISFCPVGNKAFHYLSSSQETDWSIISVFIKYLACLLWLWPVALDRSCINLSMSCIIRAYLWGFWRHWSNLFEVSSVQSIHRAKHCQFFWTGLNRSSIVFRDGSSKVPWKCFGDERSKYWPCRFSQTQLIKR